MNNELLHPEIMEWLVMCPCTSIPPPPSFCSQPSSYSFLLLLPLLLLFLPVLNLFLSSLKVLPLLFYHLPSHASLSSRVIKTPMEIEMLRYANAVSSIAHCEVGGVWCCVKITFKSSHTVEHTVKCNLLLAHRYKHQKEAYYVWWSVQTQLSGGGFRKIVL